MPHAIIRGKNGRRHEVDFGDAPIRVEIYASDETVEIFVEADFETHAEERRRFAILKGSGGKPPKRRQYRVIAVYTEEHSPTSAAAPASRVPKSSRVPKWCRR